MCRQDLSFPKSILYSRSLRRRFLASLEDTLEWLVLLSFTKGSTRFMHESFHSSSCSNRMRWPRDTIMLVHSRSYLRLIFGRRRTIVQGLPERPWPRVPPLHRNTPDRQCFSPKYYLLIKHVSAEWRLI